MPLRRVGRVDPRGFSRRNRFDRCRRRPTSATPAAEIECIVVEHRHAAYVPVMGRMSTSCAVLATICPDISRMIPRTSARCPVMAAVSCV